MPEVAPLATPASRFAGNPCTWPGLWALRQRATTRAASPWKARLRSPKTLWRPGLADYLFKLRTRYPSLPPITENPLVAAEPRARSEPRPERGNAPTAQQAGCSGGP